MRGGFSGDGNWAMNGGMAGIERGAVGIYEEQSVENWSVCGLAQMWAL